MTTSPTKYRTDMAQKDAQLARDVILALIVHTPRHGWALREELAKSGEIGQAWSLSKQLVYRAIDSLEEAGLIRRASPKDGGGAHRIVLSATAQGKRTAMAWLDTPVMHLRDVRTELVLKLMLRERFELPLPLFIDSQHVVFDPLIASIEKAPAISPMAMWRRENAVAVKRYLERLQKL